ncbi:SEC-C motif-containing protein [Amycolatopsis xylanica]|uniref:SEC-C motif-containing protein n=1 Tax=Amycolatopsis xylanica TaxID=589385 RepID=A0A1H3P517_9PSEU|nr:YchJ family metal-binding protein [Amycolatopsis xylanica]SDY96141.1 SEC-C motif-containing protein [Amycolatopsis xylanica]
MRCPCGYGLPYDECCGRLHDGRATASTAEQLMRSRFSAFAVGDTAYLRKTWLKPPSPLELDPGQRWTRLEILGTTGGGPFHTEGTVEFRAHYIADGVKDSMHENSAFSRVDGQWVYVRPVA